MMRAASSALRAPAKQAAASSSIMESAAESQSVVQSTAASSSSRRSAPSGVSRGAPLSPGGGEGALYLRVQVGAVDGHGAVGALAIVHVVAHEQEAEELQTALRMGAAGVDAHGAAELQLRAAAAVLAWACPPG